MQKWEKIALFVISGYFLWVWITRVIIIYRNQLSDPNLPVHLTIATLSIIAAIALLVIGIRNWKRG
jgi:hypothetical protein